MKRFSFYISVALLTFGIGFYLGVENYFEQPMETINSPEIFFSEKMPEVVFPPMEIPPKPDLINTQNHNENYKRIERENKKVFVLEKLNALVKYKNRKGKQTIYLSNDSVYAYWVEDKSIYLVDILEVEHLEWIIDKAQIDLQREVVPTGKYDNLGCCLFEKDLVDEIIAKCKKGKKIIL